MSTFDRDRYAIIDYDRTMSLIRLEWLKETRTMPLSVFKDTLTIVADLLLEREVERLLTDIREFQSTAYVETETWRHDNIVPRFNQNLQRLAWLSERNRRRLPGYGAPFSNPGELFRNCWFHQESRAISWVLEVSENKR